METISASASNLLRTIVGACETPVIVVLLLLAAIVIVILGMLIGEYFAEHRAAKVFLPKLVDDLRASQEGGSEATCKVIEESGLLKRQKKQLLELCKHGDLSAEMREALAAGLEFKERSRYENIVKKTDLISKIAPMAGLLGTLIPLGPGIMALSTGDTATLSASLETAFDTTSLGLMVAAVALIISTIRKRWYKAYMANFDAAMECILEVEADREQAVR